jgi:hypothetical protein
MEQTRNLRIWQWLTLLLVLCNIGILATIWVRPGRPPMPPGPESPKAFLLAMLKPGADQTRDLDQLIADHKQHMEDLNIRGHQLKRAYFQTLSQPLATARFKDSLLHEIAANQLQIESATYDHLSRVRALCSDVQKQRFDKALPEMLQRMRRPGGSERPGGPEGPARPEPPMPPGPPPGGPGAPPPPPPPGQ